MKKLLFLLSLTIVIASCSNSATNGNPSPVPGNSDVKTYENQNKSEESVSEAPKGDFVFNASKAEVNFTAYKLPGEKRTGVKGSFTKIDVKGAKTSKKAEEVLADATFNIAVSSITTGDISRDGKIKDSFFGKMASTTNITGKFGKFENGKIKVTLKLNNKEVTKDFTYSLEGRKLFIDGKVDIISDFAADTALKSLTEVCKDLHEGVTWPDVDVQAIVEL